jgi:L-xylulokinase
VSCLLGIDNGLTVSKAVVFDLDGTVLAVSRRRIAQSFPHPHWVERDLTELWRATAEAIFEAVAACGRHASEIEAVSVTAHGDGLYLLDRDRRPLGSGILSLDSRAQDVISRWSRDGVPEAALALTGQVPHASAPGALLAWIRDNQPARFREIGAVLSCKDWLRFCLTGVVAADPTEASTSFTDVRTQTYAPAALSLYGLEALAAAMPPIRGCSEIVGHLTSEASALTGLPAGTPVACGLHDVTASALGAGGHEAGALTVVAGTYSINEVLSNAPCCDRRWFCRNAIEPGQWNVMAISPASTANYDWFLDKLCQTDRNVAAAAGESIHASIAKELDAALLRPSTILFHPFLYGAPEGETASASFVGLHGWHERGDLVRAMLEGIAFNHRTHVDALRNGFALTEVRLTGGASRNPAFVQLFADSLALPVTVVNVDEAAAFGAALCAGAAVGRFASPQAGAQLLVKAVARYEPDLERSREQDMRYGLYQELTERMRPLWPKIESLGQSRARQGA